MRFTLPVLCLALAAAPLAGATSLQIAPSDPLPPLTEFQWAVTEGASLVLVAEGDRLYPAKISGDGVVETHPPKIEITFHGSGEAKAVPVSALTSPFAMTGAAWILERRSGEDWRPAPAHLFHGGFFHIQETPGTFRAIGHDEIRFRAR